MPPTNLERALSRAVPNDVHHTGLQRVCTMLHTVHVALENEIHRECAIQPGKSTPAYSIVIGECHHVSHDLPKIMRLHATKAQAGAVRNLILRLQSDDLWDLPPDAVVSDHEWIHR